MSLIDVTYFYAEINIAQISQLTVKETVEDMIRKYEPRYLKEVLGVGFALDFIDQVNPVSGAVEQRWLDLLNGKTYEYQGKTYQWMGFANTDKESPIANFIYYWWLRKEVQQTVGIGQVKPKGENAYNISMQNPANRAWNEMVEWNHSLVLYLDANRDLYPEWQPYSMNRYWMLEYYWPLYGINFFRRCNKWPDVFYRINYLNL